jgi:hypothetical protein
LTAARTNQRVKQQRVTDPRSQRHSARIRGKVAVDVLGGAMKRTRTFIAAGAAAALWLAAPAGAAASDLAVSGTGQLAGAVAAGRATGGGPTSRPAAGSSADDWPELHRDPQLGGYAAMPLSLS